MPKRKTGGSRHSKRTGNRKVVGSGLNFILNEALKILTCDRLDPQVLSKLSRVCKSWQLMFTGNIAAWVLAEMKEAWKVCTNGMNRRKDWLEIDPKATHSPFRFLCFAMRTEILRRSGAIPVDVALESYQELGILDLETSKCLEKGTVRRLLSQKLKLETRNGHSEHENRFWDEVYAGSVQPYWLNRLKKADRMMLNIPHPRQIQVEEPLAYQWPHPDDFYSYDPFTVFSTRPPIAQPRYSLQF